METNGRSVVNTEFGEQSDMIFYAESRRSEESGGEGRYPSKFFGVPTGWELFRRFQPPLDKLSPRVGLNSNDISRKYEFEERVTVPDRPAHGNLESIRWTRK